MAKKNFKNINPAMAFISDTQNAQDTQIVQNGINEQNTQNTQNIQDTQQAQSAYSAYSTHITQGKKGQKLPRINMAFSPENLEYLQIISRIEGKSITEYVNTLIRTDRASRADEVAQAKSVLKI
jgi:thiaminase